MKTFLNHHSQSILQLKFLKLHYLSAKMTTFLLLCCCVLSILKSTGQEQLSTIAYNTSEEGNEIVSNSSYDERAAFEIATDSITNTEVCEKQLPKKCIPPCGGDFKCVNGVCVLKCKAPLIYCKCNKTCLRYELCKKACDNIEHTDENTPNGPKGPRSYEIPEMPIIPDKHDSKDKPADPDKSDKQDEPKKTDKPNRSHTSGSINHNPY